MSRKSRVIFEGVIYHIYGGKISTEKKRKTLDEIVKELCISDKIWSICLFTHLESVNTI